MSARLKDAQNRELALLLKYGGQEGYIINRDWLAPLANPYMTLPRPYGRGF